MGNQSRSYHESSCERDNESSKEMLRKDKSLEIFRKSNWEDLDEWIKRENKTYVLCCLQETHYKSKRHTQTVSEKMVKKKICYANGNEKKTGIGIFILKQNRV